VSAGKIRGKFPVCGISTKACGINSIFCGNWTSVNKIDYFMPGIGVLFSSALRLDASA